MVGICGLLPTTWTRHGNGSLDVLEQTTRPVVWPERGGCVPIPKSELMRRLRAQRKALGISSPKLVQAHPATRFAGLRCKARYRGIACTLTRTQYDSLVCHPCYWCNGVLPPYGHGIDRLDSHGEYALDNCVSCCSRCNYLKGRLEALGFVYPRTAELLRELLKCSY